MPAHEADRNGSAEIVSNVTRLDRRMCVATFTFWRCARLNGFVTRLRVSEERRILRQTFDGWLPSRLIPHRHRPRAELQPAHEL
jgi:hypothetical protein